MRIFYWDLVSKFGATKFKRNEQELLITYFFLT